MNDFLFIVDFRIFLEGESTNLTKSGSGYTVTADGNIVITITATSDYYFKSLVVTITK